MKPLRRPVLAMVLLLLLAALVGASRFSIPPSLRVPLDGTINIEDLRGRPIAEIPTAEARVQIPVSLDAMGDLPRITVALEDKRFKSHPGIDLRAVAAALWRDVRAHRIISGASTITEQLIKLSTTPAAGAPPHLSPPLRLCAFAFKSPFGPRSPVVKLREAIAAVKLERTWTKSQILAAYLNRLSYGNRRLGPEAAAQAYFGKPACRLTLAESIYLAGIPQAPTRFNPWLHPAAAAARYRLSLARLTAAGIITAAQRDLLATPPLVQHCDPPHLAPNFVDALLRENPGLRGTVRTTLDIDLQQTAEWAVRTHLGSLNRADVTQAALVIVENSTGAVRALVGSSDYAVSQVNGALRPRSCGSTLKPFIYLDAIDRRLITASTLLPDTPDAIRDTYADYDPLDFTRRCLGPVRVREALACSLNVPAVVTLSRLGARRAFFSLRKWGFAFDRPYDDYGAGFILGNAGIRLVDLAAAYAGLARGGLAIPARFIETRLEPETRIASPDATAIITDILCDNDARLPAFGPASPLAFKDPSGQSLRIAGKTGTSSAFRDAWTAGFDREHTVAVWAGNFDGHPLGGLLAIRAAAPLWAAVMNLLLRTDHPIPPPPATLVRRQVCAFTGLLPCAQSASTLPELFLPGTEPRADASNFFSATGALLLPPEYAAWCASPDNTVAAQVRPAPRILTPSAGAHYLIDPILPTDQQMLELKANLPAPVQWTVNGRPISPQPDGRTFWKLAPGAWQLRAASQTTALSEPITVE